MAVTLPYPDLEFVPLDILTAQEQNELVANIEYLAGLFPLASAEIADNAVTSAKIASNAVTTAKIASNAVTTAKINNSAVTSAKLAFTTLYNNSTGSYNFTLSSSVNNFSYIWIFYKTAEDGFVSSKIVAGGAAFTTDLTGWQINNTSPGTILLKASVFTFSGTNVAYQASTRHINAQITGGPGVTITSANNILITKVIGIS